MEESDTQPVPADPAPVMTTSAHKPSSPSPRPLPAQDQERQQPQQQPASKDTGSKPESKGRPTGQNKNNQQNKPKMPPKPTPTHFLCIPLVTASSWPQLTRSLAAFKEEVTIPNPASAYGALPIPEEAIRPVGTIHLTLGVMSFLEPKAGKPARHGHGWEGGGGREGEGGKGGSREGGEGSRSGSRSRSGGEEQALKEGSLSGLRKLEEAKALLKSLKLREIWQEVLRQSQTQTTAVPVPRDTEGGSGGGAPVAIGTAEEQGEGIEVGSGTIVRDVQPLAHPQPQSETDEKDLKITLKGLHSMQSPSKATVLYAPPVDPLGHLQQFCERIKSGFIQKELMMEEGGRPLLLHATVVNTIYVKGRGGQQQQQQAGGNRGARAAGGGQKGHHGHRGGYRKERLTIDAREILERYEECTWMEDVKVEKVAICKMGAKKELGVGGVVVDEAYEVEEEVEF